MAKSHRVYTPEFRRQMVELQRAGRGFDELAKEFGCTSWSIRQWVKQAERDGGRGDGGLSTLERQELTRLRRENRQLKMEREILSKAAAWLTRRFPSVTAPVTVPDTTAPSSLPVIVTVTCCVVPSVARKVMVSAGVFNRVETRVQSIVVTSAAGTWQSQ